LDTLEWRNRSTRRRPTEGRFVAA